MDRKKVLNVLFIAGMVCFVAVFFSGCGEEQEKTDYKSLLKDTARYIADMEQENIGLAKKLKTLTEEGDEEVDDEVTDDDRTKELLALNQSLLEEKEALETELASMKTMLGGDEEAAQEMSQLNKEYRALAEEHETLKEDMAKFKVAAEEGQELGEEAEALKEKNLKLMEQKGVLEKEIAQLRAVEKQKKALSDELEKLKSKSKKFSEQKGAFEKEIADLRAVAKENEKLTKQIGEFEKEIASLKDLNNTMKSRLSEIQKMTAAEIKGD